MNIARLKREWKNQIASDSIGLHAVVLTLAEEVQRLELKVRKLEAQFRKERQGVMDMYK